MFWRGPEWNSAARAVHLVALRENTHLAEKERFYQGVLATFQKVRWCRPLKN